ncbi:MAG: patatin-like phospholipase family protein [Anaerolineae bacterium]|nr:patatin-like phospholipase family protein [Anaerolineae bacterium]
MTHYPKMGLVLSGGGIRGLAHLGVMEVLEQARIPVDYLAGTSMGALLGGIYASGVPLSDLIAFASRVGIMDFAAPCPEWRGLFGHTKMQKLLADLMGSDTLTFEDLKIPLSIIAADVESGEMVLLNRGPLIPAMMASAAFPLIFSPVRHFDRWLVDGGVVNNYPVDIVRQMGAERVIGINTPPSVRLNMANGNNHQGRRRLSPQMLFSLVNYAPDWKLPMLIAETSAQLTTDIVNARRLHLCPPDIQLDINLPNVGTFTSDKNADIIDTGRKAAMDRLGDLMRLYLKPQPPRWKQKLLAFFKRLRRAWAVLHEPDWPVFPQTYVENPGTPALQVAKDEPPAILKPAPAIQSAEATKPPDSPKP